MVRCVGFVRAVALTRVGFCPCHAACAARAGKPRGALVCTRFNEMNYLVHSIGSTLVLKNMDDPSDQTFLQGARTL